MKIKWVSETKYQLIGVNYDKVYCEGSLDMCKTYRYVLEKNGVDKLPPKPILTLWEEIVHWFSSKIDQI